MSTPSEISLGAHEIIASVRKGEPKGFIRNRIMAKYAISPRTYRRWLAIANRYLLGQVEIERAIAESVRQEEIARAAEEGVITDLEAQAILSKIITQSVKVKREVISKEGKVELERSSTPTEMINAIYKLHLMRNEEEKEMEVVSKNDNNRRPVIMVATEQDRKFAEGV
jgi:hypothetical protein